jgi:SAM-dependent methyltransferase
MSFEALFTRVRDLVATAQLMGVLGAELRLRQSGNEGHPRVREAFKKIIDSVEPGLLDGLEPAQAAVIVGQLTYGLQEALDLIADPARPPGWSYTDPAVLQERGRGSRRVPHLIAQAARERPVLASVLRGERDFLDIGIGVGWLSIEAAKIWPAMRVVGLDVWEPSLKLAETNIAAENMQDRIVLRRQGITEIEDEHAFDLIWLPSMFLPREIIDEVMRRIMRALKPDGMLVFGMFAPGAGPLGQKLTDLLTVRSGGHPWTGAEAQDLLRSAGLADVEFLPGAVGCFALGRRQ